MRIDNDESVGDRLAGAAALEVGDSPTDSEATLCIYADDLDPESITQVVGCPPTRARRKGERWPDRPKIRPAPIGQWFLEAPDELPFVAKVEFLLDSTTDDELVWRQLAESHSLQLRAATYLRSWTEGFTLPNDMLAKIARRGWSFGLSMYSAEGDEIVDAFLKRGRG